MFNVNTQGLSTNVALVDPKGAVWACVSAPWWQLATWLWWLLAPAERRGWMILHTSDGRRIPTRAIRIADEHIVVKTESI